MGEARVSRVMRGNGVLATAMALATFGLGACGGGDGGEGTAGAGTAGGGTAEDQVSAVVERYIAADEPSVCKDVFTTQYLEEVFPAGGVDAVTSCEQAYEEGVDAGEDIAVSGVDINGGSASAEVSYTSDGEDYNERVTLVKQGGEWKINGAEGE
jgi:hypothetical protein